MRRTTATRLGIALGFVVSFVSLCSAQVAVRRHQPKIIRVAADVQRESTLIGIMGQVRRPGTYRFAAPPPLRFALEAAGGLTEPASPMIRIVRGQRVVQRVSVHAAQDLLQPNDLLIVDALPRPTTPVSEAGDPGVQLAFLGVADHPVIVKVHASHARPDLIVQMLGQSPKLLRTAKVITPPPTELTASGSPSRQASSTLPDGSVLLFDRRLIVEHELRDLPEIVPCSLPEPDIGGYGIRRAYDERRPNETSSSDDAPSRLELPPPAADKSPPTLATTEELPAKLSSSVSGDQSISTIPYRGSTAIAPRTSRFSEVIPSRSGETAVDAQEPAWERISPKEADSPSNASTDDDDADFDKDATTQALSLWQMLGVLASAGLVVALALAIRSFQGFPLLSSRSSQPRAVRERVFPQERLRAEPRTPLPTPHLPIQAFTRAEAAVASPAVESLSLRRQRFAQLVQRELAQIDEPLALRPGIVWTAAPSEVAVPRTDSTVVKETIGPKGENTVHQIDPPHERSLSGPHQRAASPVERALRQLEGGRA